jgi:hypothetical protein
MRNEHSNDLNQLQEQMNASAREATSAPPVVQDDSKVMATIEQLRAKLTKQINDA